MLPLSQRLPIPFLAASLIASAQVAGPRVPVTLEQVASAVSGAAGVPVDPGDLSLPARLTSASADPVLHVTRAEIAGPDGIRLRLACETMGECLPFIALLRTHTPEQASMLASKFQAKSIHPAPGSNQRDLSLRAGAHATFLLETDRMRIAIPVISIDSGALGSEVRVASLDRKQIYHGVVSDSVTVRGTIP